MVKNTFKNLKKFFLAIPSVDKEVELVEPPCSAGVNAEWLSHFGR